MTRRMTDALWGIGIVAALLTGAAPAAAQESWVERAVHNFGEPINTLWAEGELTFAADGTMVYCSAREDLGAAPGDPKDLYIATFDADTGRWNTPANMGQPVNAAPATDVDALRQQVDRLLEGAYVLLVRDLGIRSERAEALEMRLRSLSPEDTLRRGYAIVRAPGTGEVLGDASTLAAADRVHVTLARGSFDAEVLDVQPDGAVSQAGGAGGPR